MEVEDTRNAPIKDSGGEKPSQKTTRRPKAGNSELFNEVFSACNALSVTERTRLIKSLAGQIGLVVVGSNDLLKQTGSAKEPLVKKQESTPVRPNPLRGTKYEMEKDRAYKALVEEKKKAGNEKLAPDHPSVLAYAAALKAYKEAHSALAVVSTTASAVAATQPAREKKKARSTSSRSPEPSSSSTSSMSVKRTSLVGRLQNAVQGTFKQ